MSPTYIGKDTPQCSLTNVLCPEAMQGAFAEHQVMLQKAKLDRPITIALIRQVVDLERCDALIIPGGGTEYFYNCIRHTPLIKL